MSLFHSESWTGRVLLIIHHSVNHILPSVLFVTRSFILCMRCDGCIRELERKSSLWWKVTESHCSHSLNHQHNSSKAPRVSVRWKWVSLFSRSLKPTQTSGAPHIISLQDFLFEKDTGEKTLQQNESVRTFLTLSGSGSICLAQL